MPRLLLLRHAKAVPSGKDGPRDHERRLSPEGIGECSALCDLLAGRVEQLDVVLCSTAVRTRQTWDEVRPAFAGDPEIRFLDAIFETDGDYLPILRREGRDAQSVLLVGHNPAIHATARTLADEVADGKGALIADRFPTGALAILGFEGSWAKLEGAAAHVTAVLVPGSGGN